MSEQISKFPFVNELVSEFHFYLKYFEDHRPFTKSGQLEHHVTTIQKRRNLGSASTALRDSDYLKSLYRTIQAWGIGQRGSKLRSFREFVSALNASSQKIIELDGLRLDQDGLETDLVAHQIWRLIDNTEIVDNKAKLVPCSKTLHHILPDLIVPMDRAYTQVFFGWQNPKFQYDQVSCFGQAFKAFQIISNIANPNQYVGTEWNTSLTKVIDNAIVGLILYKKASIKEGELS